MQGDPVTSAYLHRLAETAYREALGTRRRPEEFKAARRFVKKLQLEVARTRFCGKAGPTRRDVLLTLLRIAHNSGRAVIEMSDRLLADLIGCGSPKTPREALRDLCASGWLRRLNKGQYGYDKEERVAKARGTLYLLCAPPSQWWRDPSVTWATRKPVSKTTQERLRLAKRFFGAVVRAPLVDTAALCRRVIPRNGRLLLAALDGGWTFSSLADVAAAFGLSPQTTSRIVRRLVELDLAVRDAGVWRRGPARLEDVAQRLGATEAAARQRQRHALERAAQRQSVEAFVTRQATGDG